MTSVGLGGTVVRLSPSQQAGAEAKLTMPGGSQSLLVPVETKHPVTLGIKAETPCEPFAGWDLALLEIPSDTGEAASGMVQSMADLLNPDIAQLFARPVRVGRAAGSAPLVTGSPETPACASLPPLYGQLLVMRGRSELLEGMGRLVTSLLDPSLWLAKDYVITGENSPALLLVWMYLNGFIDDYLVLELKRGDWGKALLAQPLTCLWIIEFCRYFVIDETSQFFGAVQARLASSAHKVIWGPSGPNKEPMAGWRQDQKLMALDAYKRYSGRCLVDGDADVCSIARELHELTQPGVAVPESLQLAAEYYTNGSQELADRIRAAIKTKRQPTAEERKWFGRYFDELLDILDKFGSGDKLGINDTIVPLDRDYSPMAVALGEYLGRPVSASIKWAAGLADWFTTENLVSSVFSPYSYFGCDLFPGAALSTFIGKIEWPDQKQIQELCSQPQDELWRLTRTMSIPQMKGYLAALGQAAQVARWRGTSAEKWRELLHGEIAAPGYCRYGAS